METTFWEVVWILSFFLGGLCSLCYMLGASSSSPKISEEESDLITNDWDAICQSAIDKAIEGNASARVWVTKHVFQKQTEEKVTEDVKTDKSIIDEAIKTLVKAMGYKRGEAKDLVLKVVSEKDFDTLDSLITHILKG